MKKIFIKITMALYLKFRKKYEKQIFDLLSEKNLKEENLWSIISEYDIEKFSKYINAIEYKADMLEGLLDMSFPKNNPNYFFSNLSYGRDCDDWSRLWVLYLEKHGWEEISEVCVTTTKHPFKESHFITVAKKDGKYHCFNYEYSSIGYVTFEEAVYKVCDWDIYNKDNLVWTKY